MRSWGSIVFFWIAPAVVAGVGPFALVGWTMQPPLLGLPSVRVVGVAAVVAGLACLLDCFALRAVSCLGPGRRDGAGTGGVGCREAPGAGYDCWFLPRGAIEASRTRVQPSVFFACSSEWFFNRFRRSSYLFLLLVLITCMGVRFHRKMS